MAVEQSGLRQACGWYCCRWLANHAGPILGCFDVPSRGKTLRVWLPVPIVAQHRIWSGVAMQGQSTGAGLHDPRRQAPPLAAAAGQPGHRVANQDLIACPQDAVCLGYARNIQSSRARFPHHEAWELVALSGSTCRSLASADQSRQCRFARRLV